MSAETGEVPLLLLAELCHVSPGSVVTAAD